MSRPTCKRTCETCEQQYQPKHYKQRYCSDNCGHKAWRDRNRPKLRAKAKAFHAAQKLKRIAS